MFMNYGSEKTSSYHDDETTRLKDEESNQMTVELLSFESPNKKKWFLLSGFLSVLALVGYGLYGAGMTKGIENMNAAVSKSYEVVNFTDSEGEKLAKANPGKMYTVDGVEGVKPGLSAQEFCWPWDNGCGKCGCSLDGDPGDMLSYKPLATYCQSCAIFGKCTFYRCCVYGICKK